MMARRAWGWICGLATLAVVAGPPLMMAAAIGIDVGSDHLARITAFPLALAASDPTVWEASRNSLMVAAMVAFGSLVSGVFLARAATSGRFRGCRALSGVARASGLVPPAFAALGLLGLLPLLPRSFASIASWCALIWAEMAWGVPRVAIAVAATLRKLDPAREDAARLAGASSRTRWKTVTWPLIRPVAARAAGDVFLLTLFEPGAPLVLGVRRTLGFQALQAVTSGDDLPRAAALGGIAWILALSGRGLIRARGGSTWPLEVPEKKPPVPMASRSRAFASAAILLAIAVFGWIPLFGLVATTIAWPRQRVPSFSAFRTLLHGDEIRQFAVNGLILGLIAALLCLILCGGVRSRRRLARSARLVPPLIFGTGVAASPGLLHGLARSLPRAGFLSTGIHALAQALDPYASPWPCLIVAVAAARLAEVAGAIRASRDEVPQGEIEIARTLGASGFLAWRTVAAGRRVRSGVGILAWTVALAALDASPALVLAPTSSARPIVPGMLSLLAEPEGLRLASASALVALAVLTIVRMAFRAGARYGPGLNGCAGGFRHFHGPTRPEGSSFVGRVNTPSLFTARLWRVSHALRKPVG